MQLSETVPALDSTTIDRFMPVAFPVGKIPPPEERSETAHAVGSARPHSDVYVTAGQVHDVNILGQLLPENRYFPA